MPSYKNETEVNIQVVNEDRIMQVLKPGETCNTSRYYDASVGLTKVSDTPYINPIEAYTIETFVAPEERTFVLSTTNIAKIRIQKVTGQFNIYLQNKANTPPILANWTADDYPVDILIDGRADQIILDSIDAIGSIQIMEIKSR